MSFLTVAAKHLPFIADIRDVDAHDHELALRGLGQEILTDGGADALNSGPQ